MVSKLDMVPAWKLATVGLMAPVVALAQEPPSSTELVTRLRSPSPVTVAWAAFQAGTLQVREAVPALISTLEALPAGSQSERDYIAAAVLDALIQIHPVPGEPPGLPAVPPQTVARYLDRWPIQTLVLLGRTGPERDPVVMDFFRSLPRKQGAAAFSPGQMWFALANLLAPGPPSGFAALVLRGLRLDLLVTVSDDGNSGTGVGWASSGVADGTGEKPDGFPPHALYRWGSAMTGDVILSTGPRTLYYSRSVSSARQFPVSHPSGPLPDADDRLTYLSATPGRPQIDLKSRFYLHLAWSDVDTFRERVREEQQKIADQYSRALTDLMTGGHLTAEEVAALPLQLTTTVYDARTDRTLRLPEVPRFPTPK
jgi:hypothetical protein